MNTLAATEATLDLWEKRRKEHSHSIDFPPELSYEHCADMFTAMATGANPQGGRFSEGKLGRWLGWIQAACVANGCSSLEEMKEINKRCAGGVEESYLEITIARDLQEFGANSEVWKELTGRERDIFLAGMAHAVRVVKPEGD